MTMKLNKSKGKVHPSPSPSSSSSSSPSSSFSVSSTCHSHEDPVSSLNLLLPAAILTLISVLSLPDREVLAYMITRSLKSPLTLDSIPNTTTNTRSKKSKPKKSNPAHKSPTFDCYCFQCYTTYWFRWDSSPHRELIHQAIEAFEEHLATAERTSSTPKHSRRRDKTNTPPPPPTTTTEKNTPVGVVEDKVIAVAEPPQLGPPQNDNVLEVGPSVEGEESTAETENEVVVAEEEKEKEHKLQREEQQQQQQHKGLARKVLPDVIGLFNSRLWNLWGPNV